MNHCVVVGRGINYGNAFEFSLKLMETCYVIAERFSAADFVHGPIALIEHDFPAFVFMPPGKTFNNMRELTGRLRKLHAEVVAITGPKASHSVRDAHHPRARRNAGNLLAYSLHRPRPDFRGIAGRNQRARSGQAPLTAYCDPDGLARITCHAC
jgi:glucosamine 6-phosphate synthetase-like amidotransferase/phosphosugar isomerase protein